LARPVFQKPQQNQPFFFLKDGGDVFHRGGMLAKPPGKLSA
jgi:hypothetical protein